VRQDGQNVLLTVKNVGGETAEAWRAVLDDLIKRGLRKPEFLIVDGGSGLDAALATIWADVPTQRCTVHKLRNLLAHAPKRLHDEVTSDYHAMMYANTPDEVEKQRKAFLRKWRVRHMPVADSLEEAGDRLFTFTRLASSQWKSAQPPTPLNVCMRSSNGASRPRRYCPRLILQPCYFGRCLLPARSSCARLAPAGEKRSRKRSSCLGLMA
jgi:transposase-like protein